jgi:hypothetical protein
VPATGEEFEVSESETLPAVIDAAFIGSLNTTVTDVKTDTPLSPFAGVMETTLGGVVSGAEAVVNDDVN